MSVTASLLGKVKEAAHLFGNREFFQIATRCCDHCLPSGLALLGKSHLMVLRRDHPVDVCDCGDFVVRRGSIDDLPCIVGCSDEPGSEGTEAFYRALLADGRLCYLVQEDVRVVGYCWVFFDKYTLTYDGYKTSRIHLELDRNAAIVGNVFVAEDYRRRGLYTRMLHALINDLHASCGVADFLVAVKANNEVSVAAHKRRGFVTFCSIYYCAIHRARFVVAVPRKGRPRVSIGRQTGAIDCHSLYC